MSNSIASLSYLLSIDTKQFTAGVVATRKDMGDLKRIMSDTATAEEDLQNKLERIDELRKKFTTVPEERWQRAINAVKDAYERANAVQAELVDDANRVGQGRAFAGQKITDALGLGEFVSAGQTAGPAGIAIAAGFAAAAAGATAFVAAGKQLADITLQSIARLDDLADSAAALGVSASGLQTLQNAAMLADAPAEQLVQALYKMEDILGNPPPETVAMLAKLGIQAEALQKLTPDMAFIRIAQAIDKLPSKAQQISAMRDIFGKVDVTLLNLIDDVDLFVGRAEKISLVDSQFDAIGNADNALKQLNGEFRHMADIVGTELAPVVTEAVASINELLSEDATQSALYTSMIATRDVIVGTTEAVRGAIRATDELYSLNGASGVIEGIVGPATAIYRSAKEEADKARAMRDAEREQKRFEREVFGPDAPTIGAMADKKASEKAAKTEEERVNHFLDKLFTLGEEVSTFAGTQAEKFRNMAVQAGASTEQEIADYVRLAEELERLKKSQDDLKQAEQERSRLAMKDAEDYARMVDSLATKEQKAADQLTRFAELGANQEQIDAMASKLATDLVPKSVNQAALTGIQKGSKEDVATIAARQREDRQLDALKQIRDGIRDLLKKDVVQVEEVAIP